MQCANCSYTNSEDARFCENCGQPLARTCPNCGMPTSPSARFCKNCGYNLTNVNPPSVRGGPLESLRQAAPPEIAGRILAARDRMPGERKLVTTLFADIVSSTALAEHMDPEDWRDIVTRAHALVSQAVYHYEGTIAQLLGDGVLAFFGAPLAHEDDAERAVRAGLAILEAIHGYAKELAATGRLPKFQMRVGLNTGLVVAGNIGSDLHMEYLAVGDTVNLAARVQSAADPDTLLVTENTHRLVPSLFEFEDGGVISVKGKEEPVHVFRVLGERRGAIRARGVAGLSSPLVGRRRELAALVQGLADLKSGQGSLVAVIGEAGLGKSRLVAEWRKSAADDVNAGRLGWYEGRCLSFGAAMAHHLSTDLLRALAGISPDAREDSLRSALLGCTRGLLAERYLEVYPFLGHLLRLNLEDEAEARVRYLEGPALHLQYVAAYRQLLRALAAQRPLVVVLEDLHWADPASAELVGELLPLVAEAPIAFVLAARPDENSPGWELITRAREVPGVGATEIHLAPLSESDSRELVGNLLAVDELAEPVRRMILDKSEGNPFFVEEVLRMLIDQGVIARDPASGRWSAVRGIDAIDIPDTLQGVLAARIDRLPEDAKRALQVAAVIGRKFPVRVLEEVLRQEEAVM